MSYPSLSSSVKRLRDSKRTLNSLSIEVLRLRTAETIAWALDCSRKRISSQSSQMMRVQSAFVSRLRAYRRRLCRAGMRMQFIR